MSPCQPGKIIAVAINYPGATGLSDDASEPFVFIKPSSSVIGNERTIIYAFTNTPAWGECELGIVIGDKVFRADKEVASKAVYGYTVANDVTVENVQGRDHHLARSKAADTFCVIGPWIDTEFVPNNQLIQGYHNGHILREGRLDMRIWKEPDLLVWLSSWMTLDPGDVILTGAPTRVRGRQFFEDGDSFRCVINGLGELENDFKYAYE